MQKSRSSESGNRPRKAAGVCYRTHGEGGGWNACAFVAHQFHGSAHRARRRIFLVARRAGRGEGYPPPPPSFAAAAAAACPTSSESPPPPFAPPPGFSSDTSTSSGGFAGCAPVAAPFARLPFVSVPSAVGRGPRVSPLTGPVCSSLDVSSYPSRAFYFTFSLFPPSSSPFLLLLLLFTSL